MRGNIVFRYQLFTAWGDLLCEVIVIETARRTLISSFADGKKQKRITVGLDTVDQIQRIVAEHEIVFAYNTLEYPIVLDGVHHRFVFSDKNKKKSLLAWNLGKVNNPRTVFFSDEPLKRAERPQKGHRGTESV